MYIYSKKFFYIHVFPYVILALVAYMYLFKVVLNNMYNFNFNGMASNLNRSQTTSERL